MADQEVVEGEVVERRNAGGGVNPWKGDAGAVQERGAAGAVATVHSQKALQEKQAQFVMAQQYPRKPVEVMDRILEECRILQLAEQATYAYARGGSQIQGPTIRMAEVLIRHWGNAESGWRVLFEGPDYSEIEAFTIDLQTNTRHAIEFRVPHYRHTKQGSYALTDPRDIYEHLANQAQRRKRRTIIDLIPGYVVEEALKECAKTLREKIQITPERIAKMVETFAAFGVTKAQLEARVQRRIESIQPAQMVALGNIFNSLRDGMSEPAQWFDPVEAGSGDGKPAGDGEDEKGVKARLKKEQRRQKDRERRAKKKAEREAAAAAAKEAEENTGKDGAEAEAEAVDESKLPKPVQTILAFIRSANPALINEVEQQIATAPEEHQAYLNAELEKVMEL